MHIYIQNPYIIEALDSIILFDNEFQDLVVLDPSHIRSTLAEYLTLHIQAVLTHKAHSSLASGHTAGAAALAVVGRVLCESLVRCAGFCHFNCSK